MKQTSENTSTALHNARRYRNFKISLRRYAKDFLLIATGILCASLGLKGFLLPNELVDGGAAGVSIMLSLLTKWPIALFIILVNAPFILLGAKVVSREFAIKTALAIGGLALALMLIPFPQITQEKLLVAAFGGFFLGAGIGLSIRGGGVIDGTEVLAITLSRKLGTTIGDIILAINILIFLTAALLFDIETAMYSMITYLSASKTVDFIVEGIEEYLGIMIVTTKPEEISSVITRDMGKGITVLSGKRGVGKTGNRHETDVLYTVVTRLEISRLYTEIEKVDPHAFIVTTSVKDTKGGMIKKRPLAH
jgi:uncharacterized membrane-anchored protein YitT (DUF2179 family)